MKLHEELEELNREVQAATLPKVLQAFDKSVADMKKASIAGRALKVGDLASNFSLPDMHGNNVKLSHLLLDGPVILSFYRGGWCPYCNLELRALLKALPEIQNSGAQVVAISPEKPENSLSTVRKNTLDYLVLSDVSSEVARKFGVSFILPTYLKKIYRTFGLNLEKYNNAKTVELPIPATFLIDSNQVIQYAFVDEDYTQRAATEEILETLAALKQEECVYC